MQAQSGNHAEKGCRARSFDTPSHSFGRLRMTEGLRRNTGELRMPGTDYFPQDAHDVDWLPYVGKWGWILVTKDWNIQANPTERDAIINPG